MANVQKAYTKVIEGRGVISFRDVQRLLIAPGFRLAVYPGATIFTCIQMCRAPSIFSLREKMQSCIKYASFGI
jgi:hypothetical protein